VMRYRLEMSAKAADPEGLFRAVVASGFVSEEGPVRLLHHGPDVARWSEALAAAEERFSAVYADDGYLSLDRFDSTVQINRDLDGIDAQALVDTLATWPFNLLTIAPLERLWYRQWQTEAWDEPLFFEEQAWPDLGLVGFGAAFKGEGHARLSNRAALDLLPLKVYRGPNDTTLVQLYDPDEPDEEARLRQHNTALEALGVSRTGIFMIRPAPCELEGMSVDGDTVWVDIGTRDMLVQEPQRARLRQWHDGLARTAFRFATEAHARPHLHNLWLRGVECWVGDTRLDLDYTPVPDPPAWVQALS